MLQNEYISITERIDHLQRLRFELDMLIYDDMSQNERDRYWKIDTWLEREIDRYNNSIPNHWH